MKPYFLLFALLAIFSCDPDKFATNDDEPEVEIDTFEITDFLWQVPVNDAIDPSSLETLSRYPILHNGTVVWNLPGQAGFVAIDTIDGTKIWDNRGSTNNLWNPEAPKVQDNYLYYVKAGGFRKMNLNTGIIEIGYLWPNKDEFMDRSIEIDKDYLYAPISEYESLSLFSEWVRSPLSDLTPESWERFDRQLEEENDGFEPENLDPTFFTKSNGDELIIYIQNNIKYEDEWQNFSRINAFNITENKMEWMLNGNFHPYEPIIEGNRIYTFSFDYYYCIDSETGEVIWKKSNSESGLNVGYNGSNLKLVSYEDIIVSIGSNERIVALNKETGGLKWSRTFEVLTNQEDRFSVGSLDGRINIFKNKLHYINDRGDVMVLDLNNGRTNRYYLPERSVYDDAGNTLFGQDFNGHDIIIDDNGVIYASDGHRFLAFRLPE